jgi:hypothetical protein
MPIKRIQLLLLLLLKETLLYSFRFCNNSHHQNELNAVIYLSQLDFLDCFYNLYYFYLHVSALFLILDNEPILLSFSNEI